MKPPYFSCSDLLALAVGQVLLIRAKFILRLFSLIFLLLAPASQAVVSSSDIALPTLAGPGRSVAAGPGLRQGAWHSFGPRDGLSGATVNDMVQDRQGRLWMTTDFGLCRFDGRTFTTFTQADGLPDDEIRDLLIDRDEILWISTSSGIVRFDGKHFMPFVLNVELEDGEYPLIYQDRDGHMWFALMSYGGVSSDRGVIRYDGDRFRTFNTKDGLAHEVVTAIYQDRAGDMWFGTKSLARDQLALSRYDGERFTTIKSINSPFKNTLSEIIEDRQGDLWFATHGNGVFRYDGDSVQRVGTESGLSEYANHTRAIVADSQGHLWFCTGVAGAIRYDGISFKRFTVEEDGLADGIILSALEDRDGFMWFGTLSSGIMRYDGAHISHFKNMADSTSMTYAFGIIEDHKDQVLVSGVFGVARFDGQQFVRHVARDSVLVPGWAVWDLAEDAEGNIWLAHGGAELSKYDGQQLAHYGNILGNDVNKMHWGRDGDLWFSGRWEGGPLRRFDGEGVQILSTAADPFEQVYDLLQDREGRWWLATEKGIYYYEGQEFSKLDSRFDELRMQAVLQDRAGHLWFATTDDGVYRYDGRDFEHYTPADGLVGENIFDIIEDRDGRLWFGHHGYGLSVYDGQVFQGMSRRDMLVSNSVQQLMQDKEGAIWITTDLGITRYRPVQTAPIAAIEEIVADRTYGPVDRIRLPSTQDFLRFAFGASSFTTPADRMVYLYRLVGRAEQWQQTRTRRVEYRDLEPGDYTFELRAVDRDLNYSQPVAVEIEVHPPYRLWALFVGLGLAIVGLVIVSGLALRRHRAFLREQAARLEVQQALNQELEDELQTARQLQMSLMPSEAPQVSGLDIAGHCQTVNHVGGDFFQYFPQDGKLSVCLADVTGHAMEAAIPVVMFHGILESQMEEDTALGDLFARLNRSLVRTLDARTFVCFSMGEIRDKTLRLANAGCPYPYHYRNGEAAELEIDAYPLGVRAETGFAVGEYTLVTGDYLVFCSDGIVEAENEAGELFGFERTAAAIQAACDSAPAAAEALVRLIDAVDVFAGAALQGDDRTVVVVGITD